MQRILKTRINGPGAGLKAPAGAQPKPKFEVSEDQDAHEIEADRAADEVVRRLDNPRPGTHTRARHPAQATASGIDGLGAGRLLSDSLRGRFENAFSWDFSEVRLHSGPAAVEMAASVNALAFTRGRDIIFSGRVSDPEASKHHRLLAHELAHVVQQDMGAGATSAPASTPVSAASTRRVQAAPVITSVTTSAAELGVGSGVDITATANGARAGTPVTWSINPGAGGAPAGVSVVGGGRRVRIRAAQPGAGVVGGTALTIRAEVTGAAPPDLADSLPVTLVQVVSASYTAAPPLAGVPSLVAGVPPANTGEPNRDGIAGNTVVVNTVTAPAARPVRVAFRRALGGTVAGNTITPGSTTGDMQLRITDTATAARLDEAAPAVVPGGAALMAELTINPVPLPIRQLVNVGALGGPYGFQSQITFRRSDTTANPLSRIVGEQVTLITDELGRPPVNGAFNPGPNLLLAVPANAWIDQIGAGTMTPIPGTTMVSIDVNRFVGPGVPSLPRGVTLRQEFIYFSWQGGGAVFSNVFERGRQRKTLVRQGANFRFLTEHIFPGASLTPVGNEAYVGPALINLTNPAAAPTAVGAASLAADTTTTANLGVASNVAGRTVNWSVLEGDISITGGNPATLPATATVRAGARAGNFRVRVADSIFPNRRVDGRVRVAAVQLRGMNAVPNRVPVGTNTSLVSVTANPGARTLNWLLDATAVANGVTIAPATTGPGLAMNATVTRPGGFRGSVTVTAVDSVAGGVARASARIQFL